MNNPLSIVKYNRPGIKKGLNISEQPFNLNAVGRSQLKYAACITLISGIATNSITAISCILSPKFNIFKPFRVFSLQSSPTNRLMPDRWWFSFARFIKKETKSCQINRTIPRTVRWPVWNLVRGSIRIMQMGTLVLSCVATNKERAVGMSETKKRGEK